MASELNHHVGYSHENECWFVRFYPYQTEQQAIDAAEAFTGPTPVAPVSPDATGKCGELVTVAWFQPSQRCCDNGWMEAMAWQEGEFSAPVVLRSQAVELLAAERAEKEIAERNRDAARENFLTMQKSAAKLLERAEKAEADNAALIHDLNRIKDHETELVNDNAAKDARIKELEEEVEWAQNAVLARQRHAEARCEALEAKLAAAEKALERAEFGFDQIHQSLMSNGPKQASGEVTAFFLAETRAVLGGKPL